MDLTQDITRVILVGVGATLLMDAWLLALKRVGIQTQSFALVGRWIGHILKGTFRHASIAKASPVRGELVVGWVAHYAVGIAFAALLVSVVGTAWMQAPSIIPALAVGIATVAVPLFVMQPAMGAGFAASRTAAPVKNCARSALSHTVFGLGMYLSAVVFRGVA